MLYCDTHFVVVVWNRKHSRCLCGVPAWVFILRPAKPASLSFSGITAQESSPPWLLFPPTLISISDFSTISTSLMYTPLTLSSWLERGCTWKPERWHSRPLSSTCCSCSPTWSAGDGWEVSVFSVPTALSGYLFLHPHVKSALLWHTCHCVRPLSLF